MWSHSPRPLGLVPGRSQPRPAPPSELGPWAQVLSPGEADGVAEKLFGVGPCELREDPAWHGVQLRQSWSRVATAKWGAITGYSPWSLSPEQHRWKMKALPLEEPAEE